MQKSKKKKCRKACSFRLWIMMSMGLELLLLGIIYLFEHRNKFFWFELMFFLRIFINISYFISLYYVFKKAIKGQRLEKGRVKIIIIGIFIACQIVNFCLNVNFLVKYWEKYNAYSGFCKSGILIVDSLLESLVTWVFAICVYRFLKA